MRLTEACDWHNNPDADSGRYTHFDPATSVDAVRDRVIDCTGEPWLFLSDTPIVDFGERRSNALPSVQAIFRRPRNGATLE